MLKTKGTPHGKQLERYIIIILVRKYIIYKDDKRDNAIQRCQIRRTFGQNTSVRIYG